MIYNYWDQAMQHTNKLFNRKNHHKKNSKRMKFKKHSY